MFDRFRNLFKILLLSLVMASVVFTASSSGSDGFESAFEDLMEAVKESEKKSKPLAEDARVDEVLREGFEKAAEPIPNIVKHSTVSLDKVTDGQTTQAINYLSNKTLDEYDRHEMRRTGIAMSLALLTGGGHSVLKKQLSEIVSNGFIDGDKKNIRFEFVSSPIPFITAGEAVLNQDEIDRERESKKKNENRFWNLPTPERIIRPKKGLVIRLSAGMIATVRTVDELAGQVYKAMAKANPSVLGITEDPRFIREGATIELINQIVEDGKSQSAEDAKEQRERVKVDLSAIERLARAGYRPQALYEYEKEVISELANEFLLRSNHALGRSLLQYNAEHLNDWARPFRLLINYNYIRHIQSTDRTGLPDLNLETDTELNLRMKYLRLRMTLFTKPFFSGLKYQLPVLVGAGVYVAASYFAPEAVHWALSAVNETFREFAKFIGLDGLAANERLQHGELLRKPEAELTKGVLDKGYLGARYVGPVVDYFSSYKTMLLASGSVLVGYIVVKKGKAIGAVLRGISRQLNRIQMSEGANKRDQEVVEDILEKPKKERRSTKSDTQRSAEPSKISEEVAPRPVNTVEEVAQVAPWSERIAARIAGYFERNRQRKELFIAKMQARKERSRQKSEIQKEQKKKKAKFQRRVKKLKSQARKQTAEAFFYASKEGLIGMGMRTQYRMGAAYGRTLNLVAATQRLVNRIGESSRRRAFGAWNAAVEYRKGAPERKKAREEQSRKRAERNRAWRQRNGQRFSDAMKATGQAGKSAVVTVIGGIGSMVEYILFIGPEKIAVGSYNKLARLVEGAAKSTTRMVRNRKARELIDQRRQRDRQKAVAELDTLLADPKLTLDEVAEILRDVFRVNNGSDEKGKYGLSYGSTEANQRRILQLMHKWVDIHEANGRKNVDAVEKMIFILERGYGRLDYKFRSSKAFVDVSIRVLRAADQINQRKFKSNYDSWQHQSFGSFVKDLDHEARKRARQERPEVKGKRADRMSGLAAVKYVNRLSLDQNSTSSNASQSRYMEIAGDTVLENLDRILRAISMGEVAPTHAGEFFENVERLAITGKDRHSPKSPRAKELGQALSTAVQTMSSIERLSIFSHYAAKSSLEFKNPNLDNATFKLILSSREDAARELVESAQSITELVERVEDIKKRHRLDPRWLTWYLNSYIIKKESLFSSMEQVRSFYEFEHFWPLSTGHGQTTPIEQPLSRILDEKRKRFPDSPAWRYDPVYSERVHATIIDHIRSLGAYPGEKDFQGQFELWDMLSSRGVSTRTDRILQQLVEIANPEQLDMLEKFAVEGGRVMNQKVQDKFAIRQVKKSKEYERLMETLTRRNYQETTPRIEEIGEVARTAQLRMGELGIAYVDFMEKLGVKIEATQEESRFIEDIKRKSLIANVEEASSSGDKDSRLQAFKSVLPYVYQWKPKHQIDFILYLRGSIEATEFIKLQFPQHGPQRIQAMFQDLPVDRAIDVMHLLLGETLLSGKKTVKSKHAFRLVKFIIGEGLKEKPPVNSDGTPITKLEEREHLEKQKLNRKYAMQLLMALLKGLEDSKNRMFQLSVISALAAMQPEEGRSVGETIKVILERFPGVGPKIAQFLVPTNVFDKEINEVLRKSQDKTLPPSLNQMYEDTKDIFGENQKARFTIVKPLGAGSMKYTFLARMNKTGEQFVMQVFRKDIQHNSDLYIKILEYTVDELIRKNGVKWAFLGVIVDGAINAVRQEKVIEMEHKKTRFARRHLYVGFDDARFEVSVPDQKLLKGRYLYSRYAKGVSFHDLPLEHKQRVGLKILEMEATILFKEGHREKIYFDADRHAGNYLIDVRNAIEIARGTKQYEISPIDFGQLTHITKTQRANLVKLFGLASVATKLGSNPSIARKVAAIMGVKKGDLSRLEKNLAKLFPVKDAASGKPKSIISSYFSILAAVNQTLKKSKLEYTGDLAGKRVNYSYINFVRSIIQLNQYEREIYVPERMMTPGKILRSKVIDYLVDELPTVKKTTLQKAGLRGINTWRWLRSKATGAEYVPLKVEMTREELERFELFDEAKDKEVLEKLRELGLIEEVIPEFRKGANEESKQPAARGGKCSEGVAS